MPLPLTYTTGQAGHLADMAEIAAQLARLNITLNVLSYGAVGDLKDAVGGITNGSAVLTATTSVFSVTDVGKRVRVPGALGADIPLETTIAAYTSPTQVTLAAAATVTVSGKPIYWGTNDTAAIQAAITAASTLAGTTKGMVTVLVPASYRFWLFPTVSTVTAVDHSQMYALLLKSGVRLQIDGDLYCPMTGDPSSFWNYQAAIGGTSSTTKCVVTGSGRLIGGAIVGDTEKLHTGIMGCGSSNIRVHGLEILGFRGDHIRFDREGAAGTKPSMLWITDNYIHDGCGQGIEVNQASKLRVTGNVIQDNINYPTFGAEAMWIGGADQFVISGNSVRTYGSAVSLPYTTNSKGVIADNHFEDEITYAAALTDIVISGNVVTRITSNVVAAETRVTISGNTCTDTAYGILVGATGATGLVITGNTAGTISVISGTGAVVAGNRANLDIRAAKTSVTGNTGSQMDLSGADCVVTGNYIESSSTGSKACNLSAARILLIGNYIKMTGAGNHAVFGVPATTIDDCVIADNILSATSNAIQLSSSSLVGVVARNNKILAGGISGIVHQNGSVYGPAAGSPEAVVTAPIGSLYVRSNGGASTTLYVKESGSGNTGWIPK